MPKTTPQISKLIVHDGVFHADDVLCAAMARSLNPDVWIQRTRRLDPMDIELNGNGVYIADVGGGKYDHHQPDAAVREDGAKYAACCMRNGKMRSLTPKRASSISRILM